MGSYGFAVGRVAVRQARSYVIMGYAGRERQDDTDAMSKNAPFEAFHLSFCAGQWLHSTPHTSKSGSHFRGNKAGMARRSLHRRDVPI